MTAASAMFLVYSALMVPVQLSFWWVEPDSAIGWAWLCDG